MLSSLITDDVRMRLGRELVKPATLRVEKGTIARFCRAVGGPGPLGRDTEHARKTRFGGIIAPPGFVSILMLWDGEIQQALANVETPAKRLLAAGTEFEYYRTVRAGDVITATARLVDAYEREGKSGRVLFLVTEAHYTNQDGLPVASETSTVVRC